MPKIITNNKETNQNIGNTNNNKTMQTLAIKTYPKQ